MRVPGQQNVPGGQPGDVRTFSFHWRWWYLCGVEQNKPDRDCCVGVGNHPCFSRCNGYCGKLRVLDKILWTVAMTAQLAP